MLADKGNLIKVKGKRGVYHWYKVIENNNVDYLCISFSDYILSTENAETYNIAKKDVIEVITHESYLV